MIIQMQSKVFAAIDSRQFPQWGKYLKAIGWEVESTDGIQIFIKKIPLFKKSFIKIQHPIGPLPLTKIDSIAKKYNALFVVIEPHNAGFSQSTMEKHGYRKIKLFYAHSATIKFDLTKSNEDLLSSFSENARRNIKKAQNNMLKVKAIFLRKEKDNAAFDLYYQLMRELVEMK